MQPGLRFQLSFMMLLQFFIWGSWYVTMGTYLANTLKADGLQIGVAYGMMAIATIFSPMIIGVVADRFIAPKKLLCLLHLAGGIVLLFINRVTDAGTFSWVLLVYALMYAPTLSLTSSITFNHLQDTTVSFARIRVFGTLGWIIAGISIDKIFGLGAMQVSTTFTMAGVASILLAILSWVLPAAKIKTNGSANTSIPNSGSSALALFNSRSFTVFFIASILVCIPLSFYYSLANQFFNEAGLPNATSKMTLGQVSEAFFIVLIPLFLKRWGIKWMILVGIVAWAVRFLLFRYGNAGANSWMLLTGILLHGVCYDFFFVTGQMYTDSIANDRNRNAAQGMITMATYGVGMWIGSLVAGYVARQATINSGSHHWENIWMVPVVITGVVLLFFSIFFSEKKQLPIAAV